MRRFAIGLGVTLVLLLAVLLVLDRVGVRYAEDQVAATLQEELALSRTPEVDITGFPVLTQAVAGAYTDVRLRLDEADVEQLSGLDVVVRLRGVHVPLSDLLSDAVGVIPVDRIDGSVAVPYAQVAGQIGDTASVRSAGNGTVAVSDTVDVLGQSLEISGTGEVSVAGPDAIAVQVTGLALAGLDLPGSLIGELQEQLSFTYTLPPLPFDLEIISITTDDDGFVVEATATDTVIDPDAIPTD
ncbi:MAG: DUF2993 domain-containing protein [Geodermatophilaceae bacterium]|nr:DUF2993 domain-containing protein [Geodermatophilaceae bacterium]